MNEIEIKAIIVGLGSRAKLKRQQLNLSIKELSSLTGISVSSIKRFESGSLSTSIYNIIKLNNFLKFNDDFNLTPLIILFYLKYFLPPF